MKLYYASSVCSLAVRIIMHELNLLCDYEAVDLKFKKTETGADFLKINPKGAVPALQLNDHTILTENVVILQYLVDNHAAMHLLPPVRDMKRYRTLEWLNFVSTDLHRYCAPLFWSRFSAEIKQQVFIPILNQKLTIVEQHLQDNMFLMGDQFTIADSYLFVILIWLAKLKTDMSPWPNLSRYFYNVKQRASVQQALEEEGLAVVALTSY
jgi:glutathione S-transferase